MPPINLTYINNGEAVNSTVTNRPIRQLAGAVGQLQSQVGLLSGGASRLIIESAALDPLAALYDTVYWNAATLRFERAIAALENSGSVNTYVAAASSFAQGMVLSRSGNTGTILIFGYAAIPASAMAGLMDTATTYSAGKMYYLSSKTAGKLTDQAGLVSVAVGMLGADFILFNPVAKDLAESHVHVRVDLAAQPIGTNVSGGAGNRTIAGFDATVTPNTAKLSIADGVHGGGWAYDKYVDYRFVVNSGATTLTVSKKEEGQTSYTVLDSAMIIPTSYTDVEEYGLRVLFTNTGAMVEGQQWDIRGPRDMKGWALVDFSADPTAPTGAKFRYNIEADQDLTPHFPTSAATAPVITMNGIDLRENVLYKLTTLSIYWMSDLDASAPWPITWVSWEDPGQEEDQVYLYFFSTRFSIQGEPDVVTNLAADAPLAIVDCKTNLPATRGSLKLSFNSAGIVTDDAPAGDLVFKVYATSSSLAVKRGPVVEKIKAGPGISISATRSSSGSYQGTVTVGLSTLSALSGSVADITLQNAKQEIRGLTSLTMLEPTPIKNGFLGRVRVPSNASNPSNVTLRMLLVGDAANSSGSDATVRLKFGYSVIAYSAGMVIPTVPDAVVNLDLAIATGYSAYAIFEKTITPTGGGGSFIIDLPVTPGDLFCFMIERLTPASGTPYAGKIGFAAIDFTIS